MSVAEATRGLAEVASLFASFHYGDRWVDVLRQHVLECEVNTIDAPAALPEGD